MTARIKISFVWIWMAALLSASVGVSVQKVYCYCLGKTTVSFFAIADGCQAHSEGVTWSHPLTTVTNCCSKKVESAKRSCCKKTEIEKQGCTKKTTQVFQLKTEYEVGSFDFKKFDVPKSWALAHSFTAFSPAILAIQKVGIHGFERPPPAPSGRMTCVRYGVFRC